MNDANFMEFERQLEMSRQANEVAQASMMSATLTGWVIGLVFVIATGLWIAQDAENNEIPISGDEYNLNTGRIAWFLSALLLWIATVPYYFYKKSQITNERNHEEMKAIQAQQIKAQQKIQAQQAPKTTTKDKLAEAKALFESGDITSDEYNAMRSKILSQA